jgi:hypothetical protein
MILIWRGWGILVVLIAGAAVFMSVLIADGLRSVGFSAHWQAAISILIASALAGVAIWFTAKGLSGKVLRRLVDADTGQQVLVRSSAGSLFFIPTQYWAYIIVVIGLFFGSIQALEAEKILPEPTHTAMVAPQ